MKTLPSEIVVTLVQPSGADKTPVLGAVRYSAHNPEDPVTSQPPSVHYVDIICLFPSWKQSAKEILTIIFGKKHPR